MMNVSVILLQLLMGRRYRMLTDWASISHVLMLQANHRTVNMMTMYCGSCWKSPVSWQPYLGLPLVLKFKAFHPTSWNKRMYSENLGGISSWMSWILSFLWPEKFFCHVAACMLQHYVCCIWLCYSSGLMLLIVRRKVIHCVKVLPYRHHTSICFTMS